MATQDTCCTIVPYFEVQDGKMDEFKALCDQMVARTSTEPDCLYYGFSFNGNQAFCREGYENAEALIAHSDNVGPVLQEALKIASIVRIEIHAAEPELAKLREAFAHLEPAYFTLEYGFRR